MPHDVAYSAGGSELERLAADLRLYRDALLVARVKLDWTDEDIMLCAKRTYQAVRAGGANLWRYPEGVPTRPAPDGVEPQAP